MSRAVKTLRTLWVVALCACGSKTPELKPPAAAKSSVTADKTSGIVANLGDVVLLSVVALDADGVPVQDARASFQMTGTGNEIGTPPGGTDNLGRLSYGLRSSKAEPKTITTTLTFAGSSVELSQKIDVTFVAGPPNEVRFVSQPMTVQAGATMAPLRIEIRDGRGNVAHSPSLSVSLRLVEGTPGAVLSGGAAKDSVDGGLVFDMLSVDRAGSGYGLQLKQQGGQGFADDTMRFDVTP